MQIQEISAEEYEVATINDIQGRYGGLRQQSKAPT